MVNNRVDRWILVLYTGRVKPAIGGHDMKYKAIFFDRDGTLTMNDPEWEQIRVQKLEAWSGKQFDTSDDFFMKIFNRVMQGSYSFAPYKTVEQELAFFHQWFLCAFDELDITEKREERADFLTERLWYLKKGYILRQLRHLSI
jgi:FMN phosphatase YigB (HAD superfamily)